jgi:hypothetical protein
MILSCKSLKLLASSQCLSLLNGSTSRNFLETEDIPYPDVPPEVTSKPTVHQQMKEMREWFRAWHNQNYKKRDYRKYFKPVLPEEHPGTVCLPFLESYEMFCWAYATKSHCDVFGIQHHLKQQ